MKVSDNVWRSRRVFRAKRSTPSLRAIAISKTSDTFVHSSLVECKFLHNKFNECPNAGWRSGTVLICNEVDTCRLRQSSVYIAQGPTPDIGTNFGECLLLGNEPLFRADTCPLLGTQPSLLDKFVTIGSILTLNGERELRRGGFTELGMLWLIE
jgi:hypothetical protein